MDVLRDPSGDPPYCDACDALDQSSRVGAVVRLFGGGGGNEKSSIDIYSLDDIREQCGPMRGAELLSVLAKNGFKREHFIDTHAYPFAEFVTFAEATPDDMYNYLGVDSAFLIENVGLTPDELERTGYTMTQMPLLTPREIPSKPSLRAHMKQYRQRRPKTAAQAIRDRRIVPTYK